MPSDAIHTKHIKPHRMTVATSLILSGKVINNRGIQLQQNVFSAVNFKTKQRLGYFRRHSIVLTSYLRKEVNGQGKC